MTAVETLRERPGRSVYRIGSADHSWVLTWFPGPAVAVGAV